MRTIRVSGKGRLKVRPDMTRITMTLGGLYPEYGETLHRSSADTEELRELLSGFGFERSDLKTLSFSVDPEYESYLDENKNYQQRFVGYRFRHMLKVEFASDNDRLGKILYALAACALSPEFHISYTVKDPEAAKNLLLGKAVADAEEKSAVLTRAADVTRKDIQSIDFEYRPMNGTVLAEKRMAMPAGGSYDMDIEPDEIEVSDTVTVVWEIE